MEPEPEPGRGREGEQEQEQEPLTMGHGPGRGALLRLAASRSCRRRPPGHGSALQRPLAAGLILRGAGPPAGLGASHGAPAPLSLSGGGRCGGRQPAQPPSLSPSPPPRALPARAGAGGSRRGQAGEQVGSGTLHAQLRGGGAGSGSSAPLAWDPAGVALAPCRSRAPGGPRTVPGCP